MPGLYERLVLDEPVRRSDAIFVMAGLPERKQYGLELYRAGVAPRLVLSVGRFEVSRIGRLQIPRTDELIAIRDATAPEERHFFVELSAEGVRIEKVWLPSWTTCGELWGLLRFLERERPGRVVVISTGVHLRRVALTIRRLGGRGVEFSYCAVPERLQRGREDSRFVRREALKLAGYCAIFSMPRRVWRPIFGVMT